jgi:hypothetical protein
MLRVAGGVPWAPANIPRERRASVRLSVWFLSQAVLFGSPAKGRPAPCEPTTSRCCHKQPMSGEALSRNYTTPNVLRQQGLSGLTLPTETGTKCRRCGQGTCVESPEEPPSRLRTYRDLALACFCPGSLPRGQRNRPRSKRSSSSVLLSLPRRQGCRGTGSGRFRQPQGCSGARDGVEVGGEHPSAHSPGESWSCLIQAPPFFAILRPAPLG